MSKKVPEAFKKFKLTPDIVPVAPVEMATVFYRGIQAKLGNHLTPLMAKNKPKLEWKCSPKTMYTLIMIDPDAPSRKTPKYKSVNHWLVINIPRNDINEGDEITSYAGSMPPENTGSHRYIFLIYKQNGKVVLSKKMETPKERFKFSVSKFAATHNLGEPIFGAFFQCKYDENVPRLREKYDQKH